MNRVRYCIEFEINLDKLHFPKTKDGALYWPPEACIEDYIEHYLFEGYELPEGIEEIGTRCIFSKELLEKTVKILVDNLWDLENDPRTKNLHSEYSSKEEAYRGVLKEATEAFGDQR